MLGGSSDVGDLLVRKWVRDVRPARTFDFGMGGGKYGEMVHTIYPAAKVFGCDTCYLSVEAMKILHRYDTSFHSDLREEVHAAVAQSCDLWVFGDVLTQIPKEDLSRVWAAANLGPRRILVTVPIGACLRRTLYPEEQEVQQWSCTLDDVYAWPLRILAVCDLQASTTQSSLHVLAETRQGV
jgi:hypothetical protein